MSRSESIDAIRVLINGHTRQIEELEQSQTDLKNQMLENQRRISDRLKQRAQLEADIVLLQQARKAPTHVNDDQGCGGP